MSYTLFFRQMTGVINIHNRGEFYEYSILDCHVINFQSFLYRFSIHEMPLFGEVVGANSSRYCQILLKFSPHVVFKETKTSLRIFEKLKIFTETGDTQSLHFWSNFGPFFPLKKMATLKKIRVILEEKSTHWAMQKL